MLTIVDKPLIQYVVDEAREAGIEHFVFVTGRNKGVIEDHFDRMFELDSTLAARGKKTEMEILERNQPAAGAMSFTRQQGAARPRPRRVVRAPHHRQRAVCRRAAGRAGTEHAGLSRPR